MWMLGVSDLRTFQIVTEGYSACTGGEWAALGLIWVYLPPEYTQLGERLPFSSVSLITVPKT